MFHFDNFLNIVNVTGTHLKTVEEFKMIAVQRVIKPATMIKMKEHIYQSLQNLTLKVLDLSDNSAVLLQPGLAVYLPYLEVFRVGALTLMIFESDKYTIACTVAELVMHANIREFVLSFPEKGAVAARDSEGDLRLNPINERDTFLYCVQHLNISSDLCDIVYCVCVGLKESPCQPYGREIHITDLLIPPQRGQPFGLGVPLPPTLEKFVYSHFPAVVVDHTINFYFSAFNWSNNLRYVDVSYNNLKFELSPKFTISGLPHLRFFNLQGNDIIFF